MKKAVFFILFFLIFLSFFSFNKTGAQESPTSVPTLTPTPEPPAQKWVCLDAVRCDQQGAGCANSSGHRARLTTSNNPSERPAPNQTTYVLVCITTEKGNICTTGDGGLDEKVLGYNGVFNLQNSAATGGFQFGGLFAQGTTRINNLDNIQSNNERRLTYRGVIAEPLEWQDATSKGVGRRWMALNLVETIPSETGTGGQQQGIFTFEGSLEKCATIRWDPYGIVFDSQSLEPVPQAKVTLLKKRDDGSFTPVSGKDVVSIINPQTTLEDGAFSFYVPEGTYKLDVKRINYNFPNKKELKSGYSQIYPASDIYRGEEIIEQEKIEHRDIPIDPEGTPYTANVKLMAYSELFDKATNRLFIQGRVSHPLTTIKVWIKERNILTAVSDNQGEFSLEINLNDLTPEERNNKVELEFIKHPLMGVGASPSSFNFFDSLKMLFSQMNKSALAISVNQPSSTSFSLEPIFNYIEGYAYDEEGNIIPNATVGVYLKSASKPFYQTKADAKGFFIIPSAYLPPLSYDLRYTSPTGISRKITTSQFASDNHKYLSTNKVNLYSVKNKLGETVTKQTSSSPGAKLTSPPSWGKTGGQAPITTGKPPFKLTSSNTKIMVAVIILFLLIATTAVVGGFYLYKKRQQSLS